MQYPHLPPEMAYEMGSGEPSPSSLNAGQYPPQQQQHQNHHSQFYQQQQSHQHPAPLYHLQNQHQHQQHHMHMPPQMPHHPAVSMPPNVQHYSQPPPPQMQSPMPGFFVMPEATGSAESQASKAASRGRRKSAPGSESVKHRRTRSGCFTCRTRRVKCDETHPVCERCQKGGRDCTYPDIVPSAKSAGNPKKRDKPGNSREGSSSLEDVEEEEYDDKPSPLGSSFHGQLKSSLSQSHIKAPLAPLRRDSWPSSNQSSRITKPGSFAEQSPSPHSGYPESSAPTSPSDSLQRNAPRTDISEWAHLPQDVAFLLNYHRQMLSAHHYLLRRDPLQFFKTTLLNYAVQPGNEALMYAVAAFSSFHYSVHYKTGKFQTFLEYYNKALGLLRVSLDQEHNIATVITILQISSFEEYLGDWVNLMEHRNAASKIIQSILTPESMAASAEYRFIFNWFAHFDMLAAMMAGHRTTIGHEWSEHTRKAVDRELLQNPDDIVCVIEVAMIGFRELALDISIMTAKRAQNLLTLEEFLEEARRKLQMCEDWWNGLDPRLFENAEEVQLHQPSDPDHEDFCPFNPARIFIGDCWPVNFLYSDYYGIKILLQHQMALTNNTSTEASIGSLSRLAVKICEHAAAVDGYPDTPAGTLLVLQASIGLAALWLPKDPQYRRWLQRQLAKVEQMGFIFPLAFRTRMAELWGDPQLKHSWISNSTETAIGITIRQLVDARDAQLPKDSAREDLRRMRSLMKEMRLDSKGSGVVPQSPSEDGEPQSSQPHTNGFSQPEDPL